MDVTKMPCITQRQCKREKLPNHRCPSSTGDPQLKHKNEDGVEHCVNDSTQNHAAHRIFRASVCARQVAHTVHDNQQRHSQRGNARIAFCI